MNILAFTSSGNRDGTVNQTCLRVLEGAKSAGHTVKMINLHDYRVNHCIGCLACTKTRKCIHKDDFQTIWDKANEADILIFGAPIYCHTVPGILKDFIDRSCSMVIPYINIHSTDGIFDKMRSASKYMQDFKTNAPFKKKKMITVMACSSPNSDFKAADEQMKMFVNEMGSKIVHKIRCPDTLFRLNPKAIDKVYQKAIRVGAHLK